MTSDVLDILDLDEPGPRKSLLNTRVLLNRTDKKKPLNKNAAQKRPGHIPREVWGLQNTFKNELPPLIPTDESVIYKQPKVVIGAGRVRRWKWMPFTNSARSDNLQLYHWRRADDASSEGDYYFARFNKHIEVPSFTKTDYKMYPQDPKWNYEQTEHLMELARQFDVHFIHMQDRWDSDRFPPRPSVEDLKARYYSILSSLDVTNGTNLSQGMQYDVEHERKRKQQLNLLYGRTRDEVEEEERLIAELNRIEARRRDRERKKQDLQKLISQAELVARDASDLVDFQATSDDRGGSHHGMVSSFCLTGTCNSAALATSSCFDSSSRKRSVAASHNALPIGSSVSSSQLTSSQPLSAEAGSLAGSRLQAACNRDHHQASISAGLSAAAAAVSNSLLASASIAFPDLTKSSGVHLRSQRMKLPQALGQRKIRVIENFLSQFQMDPNPPATAKVVDAYNQLRSNILLLYDLRAATLQCDYELQAARSRMELFAPNRALPVGLANVTKPGIEVLPRPTSGECGPSSSSSHPAGVDLSIMAALKLADSKRPAVMRHSLGIPGAIAAASGTVAIAEGSRQSVARMGQSGAPAGAVKRIQSNLLHPNLPLSGNVASPPGSPLSIGGLSDVESVGSGSLASPSYTFGSQAARVRRKRAAAAEQGRVMKKLKTTGHIVD